MRTEEAATAETSRKGALLWSVPRDRLRLLGAGADVGTYTFNNRRHRDGRSM